VLFHAGRILKHGIFRLGLFPRTRLPAVTLSVGNITVGGAGKTPLALWLARLCSEDLGLPTVVLGRGFRSGNRQGVLPVSKEGRLLVDRAAAGDEAWLLARGLPRASVVVGPVRARTGAWACREWGARVVILDDGFQYWRLVRDLDVVVVNAHAGFGPGRLFPLGLLREPLANLARADAVVLNHAAAVDAGRREALWAAIGAAAPGALRVEGRYGFRGLRPLQAGRAEGPPSAAASPEERSAMALVTGVAEPASVASLVEEAGGRVVVTVRFPDHHRFSPGDVRAAADRARRAGAGTLVVTAKDEANLEAAAAAEAGDLPVRVLDMEPSYEGVGFDLRRHVAALVGRPPSRT
jgi:tetraacyldisaccharide 4'-kinase